MPREQRGSTGTQGRRPSIRDGAQAPWRSSLDLVWSYSRSQAFYGENIATSPSFADRHWAGPSHGIDSSVEETSEGEEEDEETDYDDEELLADELSRRSREDDIIAASPAGPMEWPEEQLPPNALPRRPSRGMLGRRERRRSNEERSPGRRGVARAMNRNIRRIAADDDDEEERSRSRSRSPKRVNLSRPSTSHLRDSPSTADQEAEQGSVPILRSIRSTMGRRGDGETRKVSLPRPEANESTPLLGLEHGAAEAGRPRRPSLLRTPSWFRSSGMSAASFKFRLQGYGSSTFWQSWFNTVNALVGVGILCVRDAEAV